MAATTLAAQSSRTSRIGSSVVAGDRWTYPLAFALYAAVILSLFAPAAFLGLVLANNDQYANVGLPDHSRRISNSKFNDFPDNYIPNLAQALGGKTRSWIVTWIPTTEFGRPADQVDDTSMAYLPFWLLSFLVKDPWVFVTLISFGWVFLAGTFLFLFLREENLHPLSGAVASIGLATSPLVFYWLTFPMFEAIFANALALLWLVRRVTRPRRSWRATSEQIRTVTAVFAPRSAAVPIWLAIAFAIFSLLMTVYPQMVIHVGFIVAIYSAYRIWQSSPRADERIKTAAFLVTAVLLGGLCALPSYLDLLSATRLSPRIEVPLSYFVSVIPAFTSARALLQYFLISYDPHRFGSPIAPGFPAIFDGFSLTPVFASFLLAAFFFKSVRAQWGWILAFVVLVALSFSPPFYAVFVRFIPGFHFSRCVCLFAAMIPAFILVAHLFDDLLRSRVAVRRVFLAGIAVLILYFLNLLVGHLIAPSPRTALFFLTELALLAAVVASLFGSRKALIGIAIVAPWFYASPMMLLQPRQEIKNDSPLVQAIRRHLPRDARLAIAGSRPADILLPNSQDTLGIPTIHVYDSLASAAYVRHMKALGAPVGGYQKIFPTIGVNPSANSAPFSFSDIGVVLATQRLADRALYLVENVGQLFLYAPIHSPKLLAQIDLPPPPENLQLDRPLQAEPVLDTGIEQEEGDFLKVATSPVHRPTVLFVSRQCLPHWSAEVRVGDELRATNVFRLNDLFTGIALPPNTTEARLEYRPWILWAIVPNLFFLLAAVVYVLPVVSRKMIDNAAGHIRVPAADSPLFAAVLAFALCSAWFLWQGRVGINLQDEGYLWYGAERAYAGDVPIRDFGSYDPGRYYWCAAGFKLLLSDGLLELRLAVMAFGALGIFAAIRAMQTTFRDPFVLALFAAILVIWLFPRHKVFEHSLAMAGVFFANQLIRTPTLRWHFLAGLFAGGCAFFGRNIGFYSCVSLSLLVLFLLWRVDRSQAKTKLALFASGVGVGFLPFIVMCLFVPGFAHALAISVRELFNGTQAEIKLPVPWPWRLGPMSGWGSDRLATVSFSLALLIMPTAILSVLIASTFWKKSNIAANSLAIAGAFVGLTLMHHAFSRPDSAHFAQAVHPMLLCLIGLCATRVGWQIPRFAATAVLLLLTVCLGRVLIPSVSQAAVPKGERASMLIDGQTFQMSTSQRQILTTLASTYDRTVHPGEGFAAGPLYPFAYAFLHVRSPWHDDYMLYNRPAEWQEGMIESLRKNHVTLLMLSADATVDGRKDLTFPATHPILWSYIQSTFQPLPAPALEGGIRFWTPKTSF
jgi:hypothetical protein